MFDKEKLHARLQHSLEYPVTFGQMGSSVPF